MGREGRGRKRKGRDRAGIRGEEGGGEGREDRFISRILLNLVDRRWQFVRSIVQLEW